MKIKLLIHDDDVRDSSNKAAKQIFPLQCPLFSDALCIFRIIITHDLLNATKEYNLKKIYRCFLSIKKWRILHYAPYEIFDSRDEIHVTITKSVFKLSISEACRYCVLLVKEYAAPWRKSLTSAE